MRSRLILTHHSLSAGIRSLLLFKQCINPEQHLLSIQKLTRSLIMSLSLSIPIFIPCTKIYYEMSTKNTIPQQRIIWLAPMLWLLHCVMSCTIAAAHSSAISQTNHR